MAKQQHVFLGDPYTLDPGCVPSHDDSEYFWTDTQSDYRGEHSL